MKSDEQADKLYSLFSQALRAGNPVPSITALNQLEIAVKGIVGVVREISKHEAGEVANQVQERIESGFQSVSDDVEGLQKKIEDLEEEIARLWDRGEEEE